MNFNSKPWIGSETIGGRDKLFKKQKNSGLETDKDHFRSAETALQKDTSKKNIFFFNKKLKGMLIILRNYGKPLNPQESKIALKYDGAIQFEPKKNANIFKDFFSDLAEKRVRKLPVPLIKTNNNSTKRYYRNIEKVVIIFNYAMQYWKLLKRLFLAWTQHKPLVWTESFKKMAQKSQHYLYVIL